MQNTNDQAANLWEIILFFKKGVLFIIEIFKRNLSFLKRLSVWLVGTLLIFILLATLVMFSRETTLHGVRNFDFKIFIKSLDVIDNHKQQSDLKHITDVLTIHNGHKVFFPVALLKRNGCIENGSRPNGLCRKFSDINVFKQNILNASRRERYGTLIYDIPHGESYFYKQLSNEKVLIGEAGKYLTDSVLGSFVLFLKDDWHNYFLTWKGEQDKDAGIVKTWRKTSGIFYLTFVISLILFFLHEWYDKKRKQAYYKLQQKVNDTNEKLYTLNMEFNQLTQKRIYIENQILSIHKQYAKETYEKNDYQEQMSKLLEEQKKIEKNLASKREEIIDAEHLDNKLSDQIKNKIKKVSSRTAHKELQKLIEELHSIKKLWQRDLTWKDREQLEQKVTGHKQKIPFTLSQSFILFEKEVVYRSAKKCDGFEEDMKLIDMIKLITNENIINKVIADRFHKIRIARNKWMHDARLPSEDIIRDLITTLHVYKVEPEV